MGERGGGQCGGHGEVAHDGVDIYHQRGMGEKWVETGAWCADRIRGA